MRTAIVDRETLVIKAKYDGAANQGRYGGDWGNPAKTAHLEYPEGIAYEDAYDVELIADEPQLVENETKLADCKRVDNAKARDAFYAEKDAEAEDDIKAALATATGEEADYETHLAKCAYALDILTHPGDYTAPEIDAANDILDVYRPVWTTIEGIRTARDAAKAAFEPPFDEVDPLYPA